jgi:hypothetical protein
MATRMRLRAAIDSLRSESSGGARRRAALPPGPARKVAERLSRRRVEMLLGIVRALDDMLNNTSLILQFEARKRHLLFSGDAQIENWEFALASKRSEKLLRKVDLYKVGHHGSRNATPRTLHDWWKEDGRPLVAMMSTLPDFFGEEDKRSEVPRRSLTQALETLTEGQLHRTDDLAHPALFIELECDLTKKRPLRRVE